MWPPPAKLPERTDVVFYLIDDQTRRSLPWFADLPPAAIVAVVEHETPDVLGLLSDCSPQAVVSKPTDPFAILTSLIVAKSILMKSKNIEEMEAYEIIRKHAMNRRMPIGKVASAIIAASEILS